MPTEHSKDDRQARFDEELQTVHAAYPRLTLDKASLEDQWPQCRLHLPQVLALERTYRESEGTLLPRASLATILANASWYLFEEGQLGQAIQILPTARSVADATLAGNELAATTIYRTYGGIYLDTNKPEAALESFTKQMRLSIESGSELSVAHGLGNVALAELALGNYEDSRRHLIEAQNIRSKYPDQAESYKALTVDVLGILDSLEGLHGSAEAHAKEAIRLYDMQLGPGNYLSAFAYYSLGNVYERMGMADEAFKQTSLPARQDVLGDTYRTAASLYKVASHLHAQGDNVGAENLLAKCLLIYGKSYEGKGGVGRTSYLMSEVLQSLGRFEESKTTKALAAKTREDILAIPPSQDDDRRSYDNLVGVLDR